MEEREKAWRNWDPDSEIAAIKPEEAFKEGWDKAVDFITQNMDGYIEGIWNQENCVLRIKASLTGEEGWGENL